MMTTKNDVLREPSPSRGVSFHIYTLFLFIKSDIKTTIIPQTFFAISAFLSADKTALSFTNLSTSNVLVRLALMELWIVSLLLLFNLANQRLSDSIMEDRLNKPWRPLPSGRLTPQQATSFLRTYMPLVIGMSSLIGDYKACLAFIAAVWYYNDLDASGAGPVVRNLANAAGIACWNWGSLVVLHRKGLLWLGPEQIQPLDVVPMRWLVMTSAVIATTIHAQDFPDIEGDASRGRKTVPLLYGQTVARWSLAVPVALWSVVCPLFCHVALEAIAMWALTICLGSSIIFFSMKKPSPSSDKMIWTLWCAWIVSVYALPLFGSVPVT